MHPKYVLVAPARNEEEYIKGVLESVVSQTILPEKCVIVSDGSTDRTDEIVKKYESDYHFIKLLRRESTDDRNFGSKVFAIKAGVGTVKDLEYDFIGTMDTDVSFESDFFEKVLNKLIVHVEVGVGGGLVYEKNAKQEWIPYSTPAEWSVSGAMQMFRRECYEKIGGQLPLKLGGEDMIVEVMSRMNGWEVRTFADIRLFHHRPMGTARQNVLSARFKRGRMEYINGYHPVFQLARFFSTIKASPFLLDTLSRSMGYLWSMILREPHSVPQDVVQYLRKEQMQRLKNMIFKKGDLVKNQKYDGKEKSSSSRQANHEE